MVHECGGEVLDTLLQREVGVEEVCGVCGVGGAEVRSLDAECFVVFVCGYFVVSAVQCVTVAFIDAV